MAKGKIGIVTGLAGLLVVANSNLLQGDLSAGIIAPAHAQDEESWDESGEESSEPAQAEESSDQSGDESSEPAQAQAQANDSRAQLRNYIVGNFFVDVQYGTSLVRGGVLDSTGIYEVIMHVEETYGFTIPPEDMTPDNFDTIDAMAAYIERNNRG
jgi:acyl carrier protein